MLEKPSSRERFIVSSLTDEDLVTQLQSEPRDRNLQGEIYDRYSRRIYFRCLSIVKDDQVAKDFAHDIFIKIFTNIQQYKGRSKFSLWVHSISYNYCLKQLSKKHLETVNIDDHELEVETIDHEMVQVVDDFEAQFRIVESGMSLLSAEERLILSMKYWDNLRIEEISKILQLQASAVKMRLKRARDKMKKHIVSMSNL